MFFLAAGDVAELMIDYAQSKSSYSALGAESAALGADSDPWHARKKPVFGSISLDQHPDRLVLVPRCSPGVAVFKHAERLQAEKHAKVGHASLNGDKGVPLVLSNADDLAVVLAFQEPRSADIWTYFVLQVGSANDAVCVSYDGEFLACASDGSVLNVGMWKFQPNEPLTLVKGPSEEHTRSAVGPGHPNGRHFTVNDDGSISPTHEPGLALGIGASLDMVNEVDKRKLQSLVRWLTALGLGNFASMPVSFVLAFIGRSGLIYVFIIIKLLVVGTLQGVMLRRWERLQRSRASTGPLKKGWDSVNTSFRRPLTVFSSMVDLMEVVDPDLDAMTAGNAWGEITPDQAATYAATFRKIPILNWLVPRIGLPGMLTGLVFLSALYQLHFFGVNVKKLNARTENSPGACFYQMHPGCWKFHHDMFMAADVSGLMATMQVSGILWPFCHPDKIPPDRGEGFICKGVAETVPSGWLTISMLALIIDKASMMVIVQTLFSIITTYYASLKLLFNIWHNHTLRKLLLNPKEVWAQWHLKEKLVGSSVMIFALVVMTMRLAGIWLCPRHFWNLSNLSCVRGKLAKEML